MTSSLCVHTLCCCFLAIATSFSTTVLGDSGCAFPEFLMARKHEHWLYKVRLDDDKSELRAYSLSVSKSVISFAPFYPSDSQNVFFEWRCVSQFSGDSYFVEVISGHTTYFKCVNIVHLSKEVKRFKMSQNILYNNNDMACDTIEKEWDPWLLVRGGGAPFESVPCSLIGGFDLQVSDVRGQMCNRLHLIPRLEIGCFENDKVYFDFQNCPHDRYTPFMDRKQVLHCIAEWSDDAHKYIVLRKTNSDNYWVLQLPSLSSEMNYFAATLATDITTQMREERVVSLQLVRRVITNICMDAADDCADINTNRNELCSGMYGAIYCKQTCKFCSLDTERACTVDRQSTGAWEFVVDGINAKHKSQKFSVCEHNFKTKSLINTTCFSHEKEYDYHEYVFVKYQNNGCYPRFTCVSSHVVNRAMYFKESRGATWPQYEEDYYCSARTYDFTPPEPEWRVAVRERVSLPPVMCNIPMDLYDLETQAEDFSCQGRLQTSSCVALSSTGFSIMFNQSQSCDLADVHFDCISSKIYEEPGNKKVAILARDQENIFYCFIFDMKYTSATRIPASECHEEFIFWDHNEIQNFKLEPSDGICIERKTVAHSGGDFVQTIQTLFIPLLTVFYFLYDL